MKKVFILLLLLAASVANAALSFSTDSVTITSGGSTVVGIISDLAGFAWNGYVGNTPGNAVVSDVVFAGEPPVRIAGTDATIAPDPFYPGWWILEAQDFTPPSDIQAGVQFLATISGISVGDYTVYLMSPWSSAGIQDTLAVTVVPEPMTIGLLAVGGLFLRRK